ncbi:hypothetical protein ACN2MM_04575 [Alkalilimnicola ehrlichii MLHE-1]|uniref:hypothetical protein n=1 Tax=Alkalilimnicola ehrlichii TaxID=351052 RepID=UPI0003107D89|nr:hypothetical protein [Alkalilimnicola ehrlichii]
MRNDEGTTLAAQILVQIEQAQLAGVHPHDVTRALSATLMETTAKGDEDRVASVLRATADALVRR